MSALEKPLVRPGLAAAPADREGTEFVLWDQLRLSDAEVRLRRAFEVACVRLCDGSRTLREMQLAAMAWTRGEVVPLSEFQGLVRNWMPLSSSRASVPATARAGTSAAPVVHRLLRGRAHRRCGVSSVSFSPAGGRRECRRNISPTIRCALCSCRTSTTARRPDLHRGFSRTIRENARPALRNHRHLAL